jgi:hypothetical protein
MKEEKPKKDTANGKTHVGTPRARVLEGDRLGNTNSATRVTQRRLRPGDGPLKTVIGWRQ